MQDCISGSLVLFMAENKIKSAYKQYTDIITMFRKANGRLFASSVAFFVLFAAIPAIVLLFTLVPYTPLTEAGILQFLTEFLPASVEKFTETLIGQIYGKSPTLLSISAVLLVWSSGMAMQGIRSGLNAINGISEMSNFIVLRLKALLYTILLMVFIFIASGVFMFSNFVMQFLTKVMGIQMDLVKLIFDLRFVIEWLFITPLLTLVYAWVPDVRRKPTKMWRGALFTSVCWNLITWAFSWYINNFSFASMYGSLSTPIIIIMWMYMCATIFMFGGIINVYYINNNYIKNLHNTVNKRNG